ncbi:hypothetical protein LOTGIDRAFT_154383 [Lottia gigantea]|uniref:MD-2-related lipid-recognition domain-containing protein n=1 Tax=Lottia gigantea TaxID=225164 RepID=V4A7L5_LOTGI|nr:hypothetical protein LOTGIDRAFT_154383 [Lottia gigantea]ESO89286.1 hypothetical protein LOTGIDRAFT_154383 [Lottia gigantea]
MLNSCVTARRENASVVFSDFKVTPDPVEIPGNLTVSGAVVFKEAISGNVSLELAINRSMGFFDLTLPCINHLGSCKYDDVCTILDQGNASLGCAPQLKENGFPCQCPFLNGTYDINHTIFVLPEVKGIWKQFAKGDYAISLKLVDEDAGEILGCQELTFSLDEPHPEGVTPKPCDWLCKLIG